MFDSNSIVFGSLSDGLHREVAPDMRSELSGWQAFSGHNCVVQCVPRSMVSGLSMRSPTKSPGFVEPSILLL